MPRGVDRGGGGGEGAAAVGGDEDGILEQEREKDRWHGRDLPFHPPDS